MTITPGTYLRLRREAAGLSSADVATMLTTIPRLPEHDLVYWLDRIEADVVPATFRTIACLRGCFRFDLDVLKQLALLALAGGGEAGIAAPRLCRVCACSEGDACTNPLQVSWGCHWVEHDLCSACAADTPDPDPEPAVGTPAPFGIDPDDRGDGQPLPPATDRTQPQELAA